MVYTGSETNRIGVPKDGILAWILQAPILPTRLVIIKVRHHPFPESNIDQAFRVLGAIDETTFVRGEFLDVGKVILASGNRLAKFHSRAPLLKMRDVASGASPMAGAVVVISSVSSGVPVASTPVMDIVQMPSVKSLTKVVERLLVASFMIVVRKK